MDGLMKRFQTKIIFHTTQEMRDKLKGLAYLQGFDGKMSQAIRPILAAGIEATIAGLNKDQRKRFDEIMNNINVFNSLTKTKVAAADQDVDIVPGDIQPLESEGENYERNESDPKIPE